MNPMLFSILQAVVAIIFAPLSVGIIRKAKAAFQNRRGASVFQPYWALAALCRKEMTVTSHASWVFRLVPFAVLATSFALALLVPTLGVGGWAAERANIFFVAAILATGSLFLVLGGMDVASAFGGMGSSREMTLAALVEPSAVLALSTLGLAAGSWNLDGIVLKLSTTPWFAAHPFLVLTLLSLGFVLLAENARYPVDNPATHLELTMVHEAMILEYSGPFLAMLELAAAVKLSVLSVFFMGFFIPWAGIAGFLAKLVLGALLVAFLESSLVKMRFYRMQEYMAIAYFFGLAGFLLTLAF